MNISVKSFHELDITTLYNILKLRTEVFVVEQDCVYQDLDGKDKDALHVIGTKGDTVVAYTRIFDAGYYFKEASIGRVVVHSSERKYGYGRNIMKASVRAIHDRFKETTIRISAQKYLISFYSSLDFSRVGEEYLEDGIPHVNMIKE